jgi:hypothetical protein
MLGGGKAEQKGRTQFVTGFGLQSERKTALFTLPLTLCLLSSKSAEDLATYIVNREEHLR